jgi:Protein of unknown function (DUF3179)
MSTPNISSRKARGFKRAFGMLVFGMLSIMLISGGILWLRGHRKADSPAVSSQPVWVGNFRPVPVMPPQPALTEFPSKSVREAASDLSPTELVLGVEVGEEARAYPINMLDGPQREILNDTLGGRPIAVTW